jgi:hypothetical protein
MLPLLAMVVPAAGFGWLADERVEWALIAGAGLVGLVVLLPSYLREHRRPWALACLCAGVMLLWAAHAVDGSTVVKVLLSVAGAGLLIVGQLWNRRMCRQCQSCSHHV